MTGDGPVDQIELEQLRAKACARGWRIKRTEDGKVTAGRKDGSASITVESVKLMEVALHNEKWKPLTGRNPALPEGDQS
jgi:hypothetical protein